MTPPPIAVHDLGGTGLPTLYAHATGFHGRCWQPVANHLPNMHNVAHDARGHGDTPIGEDWPDGVVWYDYGTDARDLAIALSAEGLVFGVGHSMGGSALLMAALDRPDVFRGLLIYEPIVLPPGYGPTTGPSNTLATGARRRRSAFPSFEAAIENYASKPPLSILTPECLDVYVRGGFYEGDDGQVHLKCSPEHEARTYEGSAGHDTWQRLGELEVPVWVVSGQPHDLQPSGRAEEMASLIPKGHYVEIDHLSHFGPMQAPDEVAALIADAVATL